MPEIVLPIVHSNGTSLESLIDQRCSVYNAIGSAMDALREMTPNGRDYYPDPGRMQLAEAQHVRRGLALKAILDELQDEIDQLDTLRSTTR